MLGASLRRRPQLVAEVASVMAWLAFADLHAGPPHRMSEGTLHASLHAVPATAASSAATATAAVAAALPGWVLMSAAMMLPPALPEARHVGRNSLRRRRDRAVGQFVATYLLVWAVIGVVAAVALWLYPPGRFALPATLAFAATWQLTSWHRAAMAACHRTTPLPVTGRAALLGTVRYGIRYSGACVLACWPLMAVMAVATSAHFVWTLALCAVVAAQKLLRRPRRTSRVVAALLALGAVVTAT